MPESSLLDRAGAAFEAQSIEKEWAEMDEQQTLRQDGFESGLALLSRLVPAVLQLPFDPGAARVHQLHHNGFTASVEIEGRTFRPMLYSAQGHALTDERVDQLEVLIPQARWSRCGMDWLPVKDLAQLGAALQAERDGVK